MSQSQPRATEISITGRSTDMDADRNVNNAVFFTYFEHRPAQQLWLRSIAPRRIEALLPHQDV